LTQLRENSKKANHILGVDSLTFYQLPDNAFDTISLLSIVRIVEREVEEFTPDVTFTHFAHDLNIDHRRTFEAVLTACRPQPKLQYPDIYRRA
jgi:LmbE family N-acetylglucosaminyl deacetylase